MLRDTLRAALAALVLWPAIPPRPAAAPPPPPPVLMPPPPVLMMAPPPVAGPVSRALGAVDRLAARWLP